MFFFYKFGWYVVDELGTLKRKKKKEVEKHLLTDSDRLTKLLTFFFLKNVFCFCLFQKPSANHFHEINPWPASKTKKKSIYNAPSRL